MLLPDTMPCMHDVLQSMHARRSLHYIPTIQLQAVSGQAQQLQQVQHHAQQAQAAHITAAPASPRPLPPPFNIDRVWSEDDLGLATLQMFQIMGQVKDLLTGQEAREALLDVVKPLAEAHPVEK